jgi:hypothetical protein
MCSDPTPPSMLSDPTPATIPTSELACSIASSVWRHSSWLDPTPERAPANRISECLMLNLLLIAHLLPDPNA